MRRLTLIAVLLAAAAVANAAITDWHAAWVDNSPFNMANTGWNWNAAGPQWTVWEDYVAPVSDTSISNCWGTADSDPTIHIVKEVTNGSTFVWTDYHIAITGSADVYYIAGSATSDRFQTKVESPAGTPWMIDFYVPNPVAIGDTVTFTFDIHIPAGNFQFNIDQYPTPEPASAMLLGLGALLLRRR